jgi:hypothetical protein
MMKKITITLFLLIVGLSLTLKAGDKKVGQIGFTFSSFGENDIVSSQDLVGGPGYRGDGFKTFGISCLRQLNRTFDLETGIEFTDLKIVVEPNLPLIYGGTSSRAKLSLINIPATLRLNFLKCFFLNGGVFLGIDMSNSSPIDRQNGIGANLGLGLKYSFKSLSVYVNPYSKIHSLLSFSPAKNHQRLIESGFKFGVLVRMIK